MLDEKKKIELEGEEEEAKKKKSEVKMRLSFRDIYEADRETDTTSNEAILAAPTVTKVFDTEGSNN